MSDETVDIIKQRITDMAATNEKANTDLMQTLDTLRNRIFAGGPSVGAGSVPLPAANDEFQQRRLALYSSQWNSEVVAAAALDDEFKTAVGEQAKTILAANRLLPDNPTPQATTTTG